MGVAEGHGRLIVLEGPDGVGKTTIGRLLAAELRLQGEPVVELAFPGKEPGSVGELVYQVHHDAGPVRSGEVTRLAMQALHIAAHLDAIERRIAPALRDGATVVLDRFWWSAWVYGITARCDRRTLRALINAERTAWRHIQPTLVVLLRRPTPLGRDVNISQWCQLASEYDGLAAREERTCPVLSIENMAQPERVVGDIIARLPDRVQLDHSQDAERGVVTGAKPRMRRASRRGILPLKPSVVYDTYWRFAAERQRVFFKRLEGESPSWTRDPIIAEHKFTNAYRASDRVSQYLIRRVIYRDDLPASAEDVFFRVMLFKLFNKIETWEILERDIGPLIAEEFSFESYDAVLSHTMQTGHTIYSAAYIMPSGGGSLGHDRKHRNHLELLGRMLADDLPARLTECRTMQRAFELLKSYPGIGDFLAYQYVTDLNYSNLTDFPESGFVVPGPGALDGIRKCFLDTGGLNEPEVIRFTADRQEAEFDRLGLDFTSLWGRPLQLIDCQNLFCEVDKYARVKHPEVSGLSGRTRIKQRLSPKGALPEPWYPPKWGLNERIAEWRLAHPARDADTLYANRQE